MQLFTGAVPNATYPIQAKAENLSTTFTLRTYPFGNCAGGSFPSNALKITTMYPTDLYGHNINAAKKGTPIPVMARMYFLREKEEIREKVPIECGSNTVECDIIVGKREYYIDTTLKDPSSVSFNEIAGDDSDGDGIYTAMYPLSDEAKAQNITIKGTGTITIQKSYPLLPCDNCTRVNDNITTSASQTMQIYGVDITVPPKLLTRVDESGYTVADLPITYTILPADYQAVTAKVAISKKGEPKPFVYIEGNTQGKDTVTLATGFEFNINAAYEAQVILNEGTGVEIKSNSITLAFAQIYIEKQDPEYPDSKLRWNDFYPALGGGKTIVIRGEDTNGNPLNTKKIKAQVEYPSLEKVRITPQEGAQFVAGKIAFKLSSIDKEGVAPSSALIPAGIDFVKVRFDILSDDDIKEGEFFGFWNVKNNSNTTLEEVLAGEAVFVYDESTADNHIGKTLTTVQEEGQRRFDFVQELLNQVVPRKRSVTDYTLLLENGIFGVGTKNTVDTFKQHFKVDNSAINEGKNTFNKLKKDYGLTEKNRIIDKETLIGVTKTDADELINETTTGDTGLYELYDNVVKKFVKEMIDEAKRFAGQAVQPGDSVPTQNWVARTGQSAAQHGPGMSYCYGCKNTISEFNNATNGVANCKAEDTDMINNRETDTIEGNEYRGNIGDTCTIGGGSKRWAGLYSSISGKKEYNLYNRCIIQSNPDPPCTDTEKLQARPFKPNYWTGIDCSGLVYRSMASGKTILGAAVTMTNVHIYDFMNIHAADWFGVNQAFENERVFNFDKTLADKIHKGDLVQYDDHVSMVYSDKASYVGNDTRYQIIHAYGTPEYTYPDYDPTSSKQRVFSRKVIITWQDISASPTGFARIKLW